MNARELSHLLKGLAGVLDLFGEKSIEEVLRDIQVLVGQTQGTLPAAEATQVAIQGPKKAAKVPKGSRGATEGPNLEVLAVPQAVIAQMEQLNSEELQSLLRNDKMFKSKSSLLSLAKQLGLSASQRNTIPTLIHNVVKHFELRRLDQMIQQR